MRTQQQLEDLWRRHRYAKIFGVDKRRMLPHELLDSIAAATVDDDDFDETDADDNGNGDLDHLAKIVVALQAAHPGLSKQTAYRWLIHSAHGRALTRHLYKRALRNGKEQIKMPTATGPEALLKAVNDHDAVLAVAKHMVTTGKAYGMTEHAFSDALMVHARKHRLAGESDVGAFSRILTAQDDAGLNLRKALQIAKQQVPSPFDVTPVYVGGADARDVDNAARAMAQLERLGEQLRAANPELTKEGAFAKAFADNPELAARAHRRPGPTTSYPFPR
jgi:hypothetical protein